MNENDGGVPDLEKLLADVQAQTEQVQQIQRSVEAMEIKAHSRGNEVTVKLRGDGRFSEIDIDPEAIRRFDARNLGEIVTEAVNNGLAALAKASAAKFAPVIDAARADQQQ